MVAFAEDEDFMFDVDTSGDFAVMNAAQADIEYESKHATAADTVVTIDFGTVGVSYAIVTKHEQKEKPSTLSLRSALQGVHTYSPGVEDTATYKTDNVLLFEQASFGGHKCTAYGPDAHEKYANAESGTAFLFSEYKMGLKGENPSWDAEVSSVGGGLKQPLGTLLTEAFRAIHHNIKERIRHLHPDLERHTHEFTYVVTVPAIWTDKAKYLMRKAAHAGGLIASMSATNLDFALEPEAAVSEALLSSGAAIGTTVAVVDAGGGTVDVVVAQVVDTNPVRLKMTSTPSGGPWGGKEVNARFAEFMRDLLGWYASDVDPVVMHGLLQQFEEGKKAVTLESELDLTLSFGVLLSKIKQTVAEQRELLESLVESYLTRNRLHKAGEAAPVAARGSKVKIRHSFVASHFLDPVIALTTDHLEDLLASGPGSKAQIIIAAGGFAESSVFVSRLDSAIERLSKDFRRPIRMQVAQQPGMAIVRGSAIFGMFPNLLVTSRVLKYSYADIYVMPVSQWKGQGRSTHGCATFQHSWDEYVRYAMALAVAGEDIAVDTTRTSTFVPIDASQTRATTMIVRTDYPFKREGDKACILKGESYSRSSGVYEKEVVAQIDILLGTASQSIEEKSGTLHMYFGRTEITAEAVAKATRQRKTARVEFK